MANRTTTPSGKQSSTAKGAKKSTKATPKEHLPPMPNGKIRTSRFLSSLVIITVLCSIYLTSPHWKPYVSAYLPAELFLEQPDPRLTKLVSRIDQLEGAARKQVNLDTKIAALNVERQKYRKSITNLLKRIDTIEKSIVTVKEKASAAANSAEVAEAHQALKALNNRLAKLEASSSTEGIADLTFKSRLEKLEKDKSFTHRLTERISKLEDSGLQSETSLNNALAQIDTSQNTIKSLNERVLAIEKSPGISEASKASLAIIHAAGSLREAVQKGYEFNTELNVLKALAKSDPAVHAILMALEKHSEKGVSTVSHLRDSFSKLAGSIVAADYVKPSSNWKDKALQQISTIIRFRRIDGENSDASSESIVARSEKYLAIGDLDSAVSSVEKLNGAAKLLAASWLTSAKARLATDRVLSSLHNHALSLLALTEG